MPCVVCREVVVGAVCATVHATDDYLQWASSHCARTPATANGDLARPPDPTLAQPKPAHRGHIDTRTGPRLLHDGSQLPQRVTIQINTTTLANQSA